MNCPDTETFQLAERLHNKLRYLSGGNENDQDLVSLLDCLIHEERMVLLEEARMRFVNTHQTK
jgi:ABC-type uncharacterized transport system ATPase component